MTAAEHEILIVLVKHVNDFLLEKPMEWMNSEVMSGQVLNNAALGRTRHSRTTNMALVCFHVQPQWRRRVVYWCRISVFEKGSMNWTEPFFFQYPGQQNVVCPIVPFRKVGGVPR